MNRPNNNSMGLLAVISVGMFVLALVYHMLIGGRGFLAAVLFALIFALIIAALIYLFLMTSLGMEWSQSARRKIEEKAGSVKGKMDEARGPADAEGETPASSDRVSSEVGGEAAADAEPAAEEASAPSLAPAASAQEPAAEEETAVYVEPAAPTPEPAAEETTAAKIASEAPPPEPSVEAPADPTHGETTRVEPTRIEPSRTIDPTPADPTPAEPTPIATPPEEPPRVEPTRVKSRRLEPISAPSKPDMSEDYDRDGVLEGTNEGTRPAGLDAPRDGNADDLKKIKGVGPKLEKICNSLGFWHFDQVAAWSDDEAAWVDANLQGFKGRVSRDRWVEQARTLAAGGETEFSKRVEGGDVY